MTLLRYAPNMGNAGGLEGHFSGIAGVHVATRIGWEGVEHHAMSTDDPADYCPQPARARCLTPQPTPQKVKADNKVRELLRCMTTVRVTPATLSPLVSIHHIGIMLEGVWLSHPAVKERVKGRIN